MNEKKKEIFRDPLEEFEKKLKKMSLRELQVYLRLLDEEIRNRKDTDKSPEGVFSLLIYRGMLDREIQARKIEKKE